MSKDAEGRYDDAESLSSGTALSPMNLQREGAVSRSGLIRTALAGVLLICVLLVVVDSFTTKRVEVTALAFFGWVEANPFLGVLSVILVYIVATSTYGVPAIPSMRLIIYH